MGGIESWIDSTKNEQDSKYSKSLVYENHSSMWNKINLTQRIAKSKCYTDDYDIHYKRNQSRVLLLP